MTASAVHASCDERLVDSVSSLIYAVKLMPWPDNLDVADFSRKCACSVRVTYEVGIIWCWRIGCALCLPYEKDQHLNVIGCLFLFYSTAAFCIICHCG